MSEITLEKIDIIRERTGVTYTEAKEALEVCEGNVVDALIYIEKSKELKGEEFETKDEFIAWLKELIKKGNVTKIVIKKDDKVLVNMPVTAGIASAVLIGTFVTPVILGIGLAAAVVTNLSIEITKNDGSVEVVNKVVKDVASEVKEKAVNLKKKVVKKTPKDSYEGGVYSFTVNFDEEEK